MSRVRSGPPSLATRQAWQLAAATLVALLATMALLVGATLLAARWLGPTDAEISERTESFRAAVVDGGPAAGRQLRFFEAELEFSIEERGRARSLVTVRESELEAQDFDSPRWRALAAEVAAGRAQVVTSVNPLPNVVTIPLVVVAASVGALVMASVGRRLTAAWAAPVAELSDRLEKRPAAGLMAAQDDPTQPARYAELNRLTQTVDALLARVDRDRGRDHEYVAEVVHELRSPVTALRTRAEAALMFPDRVDATQALRAVVAEASRLEELITQLVPVARAEPVTRAQLVDLTDLVTRVVRRAGDQRVRVLDVAAGYVAGSPVLLEVAVANLVANAGRFARDRVEVRVDRVDGVDGVDGVARLRVDDDGPGIPASHAELVFGRRVTAEREAGLGLGLPIVRTLVQLHGGSVSAGDSPLGGARFEVLLPLRSDRAAETSLQGLTGAVGHDHSRRTADADPGRGRRCADDL